MFRPAVDHCEECPLGPSPSCRFKPRPIAAGAQLWEQGAAKPTLLFIKSGLLSLDTVDVEGRALHVGVRGPRSMLGFEALQHAPARGTVVALTPATVCTLAEPGTLTAGESAQLLRLAVEELSQVERDVDLRTGPALSRVARFFARFERLLTPGQRAPFSKRHVASLLGLRAETFSRCLRELSRLGVLASARQPSVRDAAELDAIAAGSLPEE